MQKRRMWKVAIGHFVLSVLFGLFFFLAIAPAMDHLGHLQSPSDQTKVVWTWFLVACFFILQPQFSLILAKEYFSNSVMLDDYFVFLFPVIAPLVAPLWSLCFGWLFVKFDNWLNHFPVLGKKVF